MIPDLVNHFNKCKAHLEFDHRVFKAYEGQLKAEIEDSLRAETLSKWALARCLQRIPEVNILIPATNKRSKLYSEDPVRYTTKDQDLKLMNAIAKEMDFNYTMLKANRILNAQNRTAVEFYADNGQHKARVLAAHQFLPYSDDPVNPCRMTVMIKLMGQAKSIKQGLATDADGRDRSQDNEIDLVDLLACYTDNEFLIIDTSGGIRFDKMEEMGLSSTINPYGVIPFAYFAKSDYQLIPFVNQAGLDMAILIPKLLTDLNYASQFMSHSLIWYKNADLEGAEVHPDAMINLGSTERDEHDAEIGTIDPKVDIERVLQLIQFEMSGYLSSIGIKVSISAALQPGQEAAGISKMIDEADTSADQKAQAQKFKTWEMETWQLITKMQSVWSQSGMVKENKVFSEDWLNTFAVYFAESKPFKTEKEKIDEIKILRDALLISKRQAIRELRPFLSDTQIDEWVKELDKEEDERDRRMLEVAGRDPQQEDMGEESPESQAVNREGVDNNGN